MDYPTPDSLDTADRVAVRDFYRSRGIVPCHSKEDFRCPHAGECSATARRRNAEFHTGTWPYVGVDYGSASVSGHHVRVLFVAMERGGTYDLEDEPTFTNTQENFRDSAESHHNAHMGGTSQLMQCLVDDKEPSVYSHQFALTNAVKCVEFTGSQNSSSSATMIDNCSEHLREEIRLLRPHLLITQGDHPKRTVLRLLSPLRLVCSFKGVAGIAEVFLDSQIAVLTTPHAARKKGWPWKRGPLPEFLQSAVRCAADEALGLMGRGVQGAAP